MHELPARHAYDAGRIALVALEVLPGAKQIYLRRDPLGNYRLGDVILADGRRATAANADEQEGLNKLRIRTRAFFIHITEDSNAGDHDAPYIDVDRAAIAYQEEFTS